MGLDMIAFSAVAHDIAPPTDVEDRHITDAAQLHYWRKHPNLHGWMEKLYRTKGGQDEVFNQSSVQLTGEDLLELEVAVRSRMLPVTTGFFFGASDGSEVEDDLAFIAKAHAELRAGRVVYYDSWW